MKLTGGIVTRHNDPGYPAKKPSFVNSSSSHSRSLDLGYLGICLHFTEDLGFGLTESASHSMRLPAHL